MKSHCVKLQRLCSLPFMFLPPTAKFCLGVEAISAHARVICTDLSKNHAVLIWFVQLLQQRRSTPRISSRENKLQLFINSDLSSQLTCCSWQDLNQRWFFLVQSFSIFFWGGKGLIKWSWTRVWASVMKSPSQHVSFLQREKWFWVWCGCSLSLLKNSNKKQGVFQFLAETLTHVWCVPLFFLCLAKHCPWVLRVTEITLFLVKCLTKAHLATLAFLQAGDKLSGKIYLFSFVFCLIRMVGNFIFWWSNHNRLFSNDRLNCNNQWQDGWRQWNSLQT